MEIVSFPLIFAWRNNEKRRLLYGKRCRVVTYGKMNSALVEFKDGTREIVSRNALRKANRKEYNDHIPSSRSRGVLLYPRGDH